VPWRVEILNETVAAEIAALPADMQARLVRLAERIAQWGWSRMGTSQSAIARLESGQTLPSTKTLLRYAKATGSKFHVRLSAA
jgi:hypothetical protein